MWAYESGFVTVLTCLHSRHHETWSAAAAWRPLLKPSGFALPRASWRRVLASFVLVDPVLMALNLLFCHMFASQFLVIYVPSQRLICRICFSDSLNVPNASDELHRQNWRLTVLHRRLTGSDIEFFKKVEWNHPKVFPESDLSGDFHIAFSAKRFVMFIPFLVKTSVHQKRSRTFTRRIPWRSTSWNRPSRLKNQSDEGEWRWTYPSSDHRVI